MFYYFFVSVYQIWDERKGFTIHSCVPENCFTDFLIIFKMSLVKQKDMFTILNQSVKEAFPDPFLFHSVIAKEKKVTVWNEKIHRIEILNGKI